MFRNLTSGSRVFHAVVAHGRFEARIIGSVSEEEG